MLNLNKFKHRTFCDGDIVMINADCLEVMEEFGDKEVSLILTDPPFGAMDNKRFGQGQRFAKYNEGGKADSWDIAPEQEVFDEIFRTSQEQIIWGGNYFQLPPARCFLIWKKLTISENFSMAMAEYAWTSFNKNAKIFEIAPQDSARFHPTQKPLPLMAWCLNNYSKENDLIFDVFAGSFTTAIACIRTKRRFIGCELDPVYFEKAVERVETELRQGVLF
jgi:site-specific DNA-methyltransferase (adenine-specific)